MDWLLQLDTRIFLAINGLHSETWDGIMWWISGKDHLVAFLSVFDSFYGLEKEVAIGAHAVFYHPGSHPD